MRNITAEDSTFVTENSLLISSLRELSRSAGAQQGAVAPISGVTLRNVVELNFGLQFNGMVLREANNHLLNLMSTTAV